ncbi:hypothetical protein B0A90_10915 [Pseudomonas syringae]|nr:hypothetical protein B1F67_22720 [Pseudomonas syringae]RXU06149.1 hypothetical protein B1F68_13305 [Pseudomonas syringae]RXU31881.1 hypothetical protein B0A93_18395 [Pseudomonas syringae]RXU39831.1 hypothetical protein B0A90_10915 [Pseudomonas syringae]
MSAESSAAVRALSRTSSLLHFAVRLSMGCFCRSELVREGVVLNAKSSATVRALSRTSSLHFCHTLEHGVLL